MTRNWKKRFSASMALALVVVALAGCKSEKETANPNKNMELNFQQTGFPIVKEPVTKRFMIRRPPHISDPNTMIVFQEYEKMTNVKVQWDIVNSDGFNDRVNLLMAANDMPDAILKGVPDITKTSADGSIIDLTTLIDKYAPGLKKLFTDNPGVKAGALSSDGKIYSIPNVNTLTPNLTLHRNLWINKLWLNKLNLSSPNTTDELLNVLRAFRDGDPNGNGKKDEIPLVVEYSGGDKNARVDNIAASWGIYSNMGYRLQIKDGKVHIYVVDDKWKEVLQYMNILWKEKLLDNSLYSQTSDVAMSKFNSNIAGVFGLSSDDLWSKYSNDYIPLVPPKNPAGDKGVIGLSSSYGGAAMVITKEDKTPEITMRWIDYFYTDEGSKFIGALSESLVGKTAQKLPDGSYDYSDSMLKDTRGISVAVGEVCPLPGGGFPYWRNDKNSNFIYSNTVKKAVPIYQEYYQKDTAYPYPVFSVADAQAVNDIRKDLDIYFAECEAKFITGGMSFDKWDEYVQTCNKMGIQKLESYFQKAYDAITKAQ